jgi:LysR family transcriptional regulator, hydrogen peroxide-inducible genes activator
MTLSQLEYALAVEEHLGFQRAAEACHIAQPSLSAQIKKLEENLGVTLFQRSANSGVMVTDIGREVLKQARLIIDESKKLKDLCENFQDEIRGTLRVGIIPTVGPFLLPLFLDKLKKSYPGLHLEILERPTKDLMEELHYGHLDVAILSPPAKAPAHLMEKLLYYEPFLVYGAKGHPILEEKNIRLPSLSEHAVTLLDETHCMRDQVVSACSLGYKNLSDMQLKQGSLQTLISLVESQQGFTLIPQLAEPILHLKHRRDGIREISHQTPYRKLSLVYNMNSVRKKMVEALHKTIQASLPDTVATKKQPSSVILDASKEHFRS